MPAKKFIEARKLSPVRRKPSGVSGEVRSEVVTIRLSPSQVKLLDSLRADLSRGRFIELGLLDLLAKELSEFNHDDRLTI